MSRFSPLRVWSGVLVVTACAGTSAFAQTVRVVGPGGDLQAALNAAQPGDTIRLAAGATFVGNFVLPAKSGAQFITIRSDAPDAALPPAGTRMTPTYSGQLAKLRSPNSQATLRTAAGAHHYRIMLLEFLANANGAGDVIALGDGSSLQSTLASVPYELLLDRIYLHGDPALGQKRGIGLNSASTSIINSHISDIKAVGQDSQAIAGWNGPGPYVITNNFLEGAGENVMFGGADPSIVGLVPSDITFSRNHVYKPLSWRGSQWSVKNLFELKSAQRVSIDGNVFENNWLAAQTGYAILLKSVNQDGRAPWSVVQHVSFTNNIVRNSASGINILGRDTTHAAIEANHITVRNNLFANISGRAFGGSGRFVLINGGAQIVFDHNTAISDGETTLYGDANPVSGFTFTNNVMLDNAWAVLGGGAGEGVSALNMYFPGAAFAGNVIVNANANLYPLANLYPSLAAAGFVNFAGGDYRLSDSSALKRTATDGSDPGVDFTALPSAAPSVPLAPGAPSAPSAPSGPGATTGGAAANATGGNSQAPSLSVTISGSTVSLNWPAATGAVMHYVVEAGSAPGLVDIARVTTGTNSLVAHAVPNGVYHVRVRAMTSAGLTAPSAETSFVVGGAVAAGSSCASAPLAPTNLTAAVSGGVVRLSWTNAAGACTPTHYIVVAGSAAGRSDLAQLAVPGPSLVASAPNGTYFVRVMAMTSAGASTPSNEIVVNVPQ